jgi:hypothetical protein
VKLARFKYQSTRQVKIPRWILHFAFRSLSSDPLPPTSVVADCLSIIAIDLGCDITYPGSSDERCVHLRPHLTGYHHSDLEPVHGWDRFRA